MPRIVVDLQDERPIWRVPDAALERIREAVPAEWETTVVRSAVEGTADGAGRASPEAVDAVAEAEVYIGFGVPPEILAAGPRLRWVHSGTAGVGASLTPEMLERDVVFTNSAGIHGPPMAETALGMMLYFARGLDIARRAQSGAEWDTAPFIAAESPVLELARSTVGIVGFGGVGREVAKRVVPLGARVLALKRTPAPAPDGVELLHGDGGRAEVLAESDFLVLTVPETPTTRDLIDAAAIARMKREAVLINVARGTIVDEEALIRALRERRIRGAALDVFAEEPLPADHPLWGLPNVLVTPHVSATSHRFWDRQTALIVDNIERYLAGRPLGNVVDKLAGY